ncbi:hypothetical protein DFP72DRAFT_902290 [Ephemerocybe angulata]|uniref:Nephrocystin 3-like N-terminal domain-containing protein n=1 Tax=Ephemerocybe angulata TaxID=980116 RepID=A0A8H6HWP6_9AGAR|nr:hypothetical protein DFP72DRAFT_902290 [Tulosesus angulatus]
MQSIANKPAGLPTGPAYVNSGQFLSGAQNFGIGQASFTTVAGNRITNIYAASGAAVDVSNLEELLKWINGPEFRAIYRANLARRMPQTGNWFFGRFEFALFVREKGVVLWVTGLPGAGKTVLASIIIEYLEEAPSTLENCKNAVTVYAYLRYSERFTLHDILAGLLSQLVRSHDVVFEWIKTTAAYRNHKKLGDICTAADALELLRGAMRLFSRVFVVIDGLDEVDDMVKEGLLNAIPTLQANFLITSRPLEMFRCQVPDAVEISIQANLEDIALYVEETIKMSSRLKSILKDDIELKKRLQSQICEKSQGMFLLAHLQMDALVRGSRSVASLMKILNSLPEGVNELYRDCLERIDAQSKEDVELAHKVFALLAHSRAPLTALQLQHALAASLETLSFDTDDIVPIPLVLSVCGSLVVVESTNDWNLKDGDVVRFIHYTTQEFIKGVENSDIPPPQVLFSLICSIHLDAHLSDLQDPQNPQISEYHLPYIENRFLAYAYHYWGEHVELCKDQGGQGWCGPTSLIQLDCRLGKKTTCLFTGANLAMLFGFLRSTPSSASISPATHSREGQLDVIHPLATSTGDWMTKAAILQRILASAYDQLNTRDVLQGFTPLHRAVRFGCISMARQLLQFASSSPTGFDINHNENSSGSTPLHVACNYYSDHRVAKDNLIRLIASHPSVDPNIRDKDGKTVLAHFCQSDMDPPLNALLSFFPNIDLNVQDTGGHTPLHYACVWLSGDYPKRLISAFPGIAANLPELDRGQTAFMQICELGFTDTARWFLERNQPCDRNLVLQRDKEGRNALFLVSKPEENFELVKLLIDHGSDPTTDSPGNSTFLKWAKYPHRSGHRMALDLLLSRHPELDVLQRDDYGYTALMHALSPQTHSAGHPETASFVGHLLSSYTSRPEVDRDYANASDGQGRTALIRLCQQRFRRFTSTLDVLLSFPEIDIHIRDKHGLSALDYMLRNRPAHPKGRIGSLLSHHSWNPSIVRKAVVTALRMPAARDWRQTSLEWLELVKELFNCPRVIQAYDWDRQNGDPDIVILLALASRHKHRALLLPFLLRLCHERWR